MKTIQMQSKIESMKPIRVLQVSYDMGLGGAETLIMNLYRNINRERVQFDFILHSDTESAYDKEILSLGGRIFRMPRFLIYNKFSYEKELTAFLKSHPEIHILHDHLMDSASETLRIANKLGLITISHSHTAYPKFELTSPIRFLMRKNLYKIADYRFACSSMAGEWLYRRKADFKVVANAIDTRRFAFSEERRRNKRKELGLASKDKVFGTVGRLIDYKNQIRMLEFFPLILEKESDAKLVLIGEGPERPNLEKKVHEMNLQNNVLFAGGRQDTYELLSAFDVFLLTSFYEGLGIVLIEAQAAGLPCIFTSSVPKDVNLIPSLIHRVSLDESNEIWANNAMQAKALNEREKAHFLVKEAGFDIKETVTWLENFYLTTQKPN